MMRRGILGGTFDPPHLAHLFAAEAAYRELDLDVVTWVPAGAPWQKVDEVVSSGEHRWEMTKLAIEGVDYFDADDQELVRDGWTYTFDTLNTFVSDELFLILGSDSAVAFPTWHRFKEVAQLAVMAVVARPGSSRSDVESAVDSCIWIGSPELGISSTGLRERVAQGKSIRFLVPNLVIEYIDQHNLYRGAAAASSA